MITKTFGGHNRRHLMRPKRPQQKQAKTTTANKGGEPQNEQSRIPKRHLQKCTKQKIKVVKKKRIKRKYRETKMHDAKKITSLSPPNRHTQ